MKSRILSIITFAVIIPLLLGGCVGTGPTPTEPTQTTPAEFTQEESQQIALEFLKNSPTFRFDGIEGSIKHVDTLEAFCPYCWGFVFEFECANAGYGDRSGLQEATVITKHEAVINISQGNVDGGTIDGVWDIVKQQEITKPEIKTAEHN